MPANNHHISSQKCHKMSHFGHDVFGAQGEPQHLSQHSPASGPVTWLRCNIIKYCYLFLFLFFILYY